ncbi:Acetyl xylan esterase (AXE1) [Polystyrenella longa]|uniref:Acetyl xylan esterase (AXE1) n=1 Tax=Polystyrenella longa TaxID=2528007 RepID=A0A518CH53_9PLAN|nr:acetylxylan esterase [Polystyrenella longa]QDU78557.1 Acetyl xylan esterase (AXE1) [Polystyrenella longa]
MPARYPLLMLVFLSLFSGAVFADEQPEVKPSPVEQLLSKQTFDANLPLAEVKQFTRSRITPFPQIDNIAAWEEYRDHLREEVLSKVVFRGKAAEWRDADFQVEWLDSIEGGPEYTIQKLRYEALPGMWIPALLYVPNKLEGKVPVVMNVNGHEGDLGKAAEYKQIRCINQAKRGMLALNIEWVGMGQLNTVGFGHYRMNQIDLCGTSGLAPFYLSMKRGLDILLNHEHTDPERVAVAGLSGGGWQTIYISSLDERVTLSNPVAGYSSFFTRVDAPSDLGDSEQTPTDMASIADYLHLTAMRAPRPTLLTNNDQDQCCFKASHALPPLLQVARPLYQLYGKGENLRSHINIVPGTHNFDRDNREQLYAMFGNFFYPEDSSYSAVEIECAAELHSKADLIVPVPENNRDFNILAQDLAADLPQKDPTLDVDGERVRLAEVIKFHDYPYSGTQVEQSTVDERAAIYWHLNFGSEWTVPVIEFPTENAKATVLLLSELGSTSLAAQVESHLSDGNRVLVVDPFYFGHSKITQRPGLYALLVSSVGERPLGIQSGQLMGAIKWARDTAKDTPLHLHSVGPRSSLVALTTAALAPTLVDQLTTDDSFETLKEIFVNNMQVSQAPEIFCFGLLQHFDIADLRRLAE